MAQHTLPEILVLCMNERDITALQQALDTSWPTHAQSLAINIIHENLRCLPDENKFDLIVSPANSYGILDGGFDDALSRAFCLPQHDYWALTKAAQEKLYERWRGYTPPGTCTLVTIPAELQKTNRWGCKYLALCPTMRVPDDARWNREVVYECVWSLMCEIDRWNNHNDNINSEHTTNEKINRILIPPLATGTGGVSSQKWAKQFVLALKHFMDALERPERWSNLNSADLIETLEVQRTWNM